MMDTPNEKVFPLHKSECITAYSIHMKALRETIYTILCVHNYKIIRLRNIYVFNLI